MGGGVTSCSNSSSDNNAALALLQTGSQQQTPTNQPESGGTGGSGGGAGGGGSQQQAPAGYVSVPAKTFGGTKIEVPTSGVFIANRSLSLPAIYACDHEVTQKEYATYCKYSGPAPDNYYGLGDNYPAYNVSWYDAIVYCNLKSAADGLTPCYKLLGSNNTTSWSGIVSEGEGEAAKYCGPSSETAAWNAIEFDKSANGWRLPTEAEWEMLARGGNLTNDGQTMYSGSDTIGDVAWYTENSGGKTHEVKGKTPNGLGLYDMSGNVWEWCWDWIGVITATGDDATPDTGVPSGSYRVMRGGNYSSGVDLCKITGQGGHSPNVHLSWGYYGFRVVRNAPAN